MRSLYLLSPFSFLLFFLLSACAGAGGSVDPYIDSRPPAVSGQIPTEYEQVQSSGQERPVWIDYAPDDSPNYHYLVGLSEYHPSEKEAREAAMRHSREQFAVYTGVDVSAVDEVVSSLYGKSSGILDAEISGNSRSTHTTDALVSRIKAVEWYWEKYRAIRTGQFRGYVYRYWVKVSVPHDEYDRVQDWKRKKEEASLARKAEVKANANREIDSLMATCREQLAAIDDSIAAGDLTAALSRIQSESTRLYTNIRTLKEREGLYRQRAEELTLYQGEILARLGEIRSKLYIDKGRFSTLCLLPDSSGHRLSVWTFFRVAAGDLPIPGLSLVLLDGTEKEIARAVSDQKGKADFFLSDAVRGNLRVTVDVRGGVLARFEEPFTAPLKQIEARLSVSPSMPDMSSAVYAAVSGLFSGPSRSPLPARRLLLGPVTFEESRQGSSFGQALKRQLRFELAKVEGLQLVDPKKRTADDVAEAIRTRGLGAQSSYKPEFFPSMGSTAMQARIDNADTALETTYSLIGEKVWIDLNIRNAETDEILSSSRGVLPREAIPLGLEIKPVVAEKVQSVSAGPGGSIRLELTSNFGDGQTYTEGETITYFVGTDRDAFVLLIYEDAEHNLIQILPNRYSGGGYSKGGEIREVPSVDDDFEFVIQAPFGIERVWGFASSKPFPRLPGEELENGLVLLYESLQQTLETLRQHGVRNGVVYGEAQTLLTTVPKKITYVRY